ncbi:Membrane proteinase PrsW, cleaves anti-sigma factor RsiW, M82 family [Propionibacterium cyclohexanicum]|uniref:Membrane proteinase PrsW, cleaves anti-sigma factor RsiW, M82 family n=2 Tax=Propionibacterium cyclohexanicum TaxID=64702 RepID=A0A1H9TME4_9ACTN|nr:Membrane proteinase PrsW, cleaves anti-sigma factor RsiW, M82 family [Propionibacterium cyclohexanicum]
MVVADARARRLSGLPRAHRPGESRRQRILRNPLSWLAAVFFPLCVVLLWQVYLSYRRTITEAVGNYTAEHGGVRSEPTVSQFNEALWRCTKLALVTLVIGVVVFWLIDRLRPTSLLLKAVCLAWGGAVAVYFAANANDWVASRLTVDRSDPMGSARAAIYVAPFVEEAAKATVLFLLAILVRYRIVGVMQSVALAGMSAVGFAVVEDIVYYVRTYLYGSMVYGVDANQALHEIYVARGLQTWWGHPLFTSCTAIGLAVALRSRSTFVRVLAPVAGYLFAAGLHMAFNGSQVAGGGQTLLFIVGGSIILALLVRLVVHCRSEARVLGARLQDLVIAGWLDPRDPIVYSSFLRRGKLLVAALLRGPRVFGATHRMLSLMTEVAYLRAAVTAGVVDGAANLHGRELLADIAALRPVALHETEGLSVKPDNWTWQNIAARLRGWWHVVRGPRRPRFAPPSGAPVPVGSAAR